MGTTTGTFNWYDSFKGEISMAELAVSSAFTMLLTTSSYIPDSANHEFLDDITNEVSGNGYARKVLANVGVTEVGPNGKRKWDFDDPVWTASGGSITARYWVVYRNVNGSDATRELVAWGLLDDTPADVVTTDGNDLTGAVNASGFATIG